MADKTPDSGAEIVLDDSQAQSIYTDATIGVGPYGVLHMTFVVRQWDDSVNPPRAYTNMVCRITMPITAIPNGIDFVNHVLDHAPEEENCALVGTRLQ